MSKLHVLRIFALALLAPLLGGCGSMVVPMSSHTIQTTEAASQDVLWVRDSQNRPNRCTVEGNKPVCRVAAKAQ